MKDQMRKEQGRGARIRGETDHDMRFQLRQTSHGWS